MTRVRARHWLALLCLVAIWGSSYLMVAMALRLWSPAQITGVRVSCAAALLLGVMWLARRRLPVDGRSWAFLVAIALIGNCLPFFLISWGQQGVESGLAGILAAATPLVVLILAHFTLDDEPMTRRQSLAFTAGFAGIVVLMGPDSLAALGGEPDRLLHQLAVLAGAVCYAVATVLARLMPRHDPLVVAAAVMLLASGFMAFATVPALPTLPTAPGPLQAAILLLGFVGTGAASILYFYLVAETGARFTSFINYLIPLWAVVLGSFVLDERIEIQALLALVLIVGGLWIGQGQRIRS